MPAVRQKKTASGNKGIVRYCHFPECNFSAKTKSGLDIHLNIHYGLKPYWCDGITKEGKPCKYIGGDPANFYRHRVRHHGYVRGSSSRKRKGTASKGSSRTRAKVANAQLESDTNSVSQPKPATKPPSTATLGDLQAYFDVEVNVYGRTYFADACDLRSDPHLDAKELIPAIHSSPLLEDQWPQQLPVGTLFNAQPANLPFPLVDVSQEDAPFAELASSEPSPTLESLRIAMDSMNFNLSLTMGFDMDATTLVDGLQSSYPTSLTARQEYTGAYSVENDPFSPLSETQSVESSSHEADVLSIDQDVALDTFLDSLELESEPPSQQVTSAQVLSEDSSHESYDVPSIDPDVALSTFLDSLEPKSEPPSQQVPSPSVLSDYFNSSSYRPSDLESFGVSTLNFGG
ncbi:hypothetical protein EV421DRAFT_1743845 [Armillaria borealis]|uniref:C2H2-type domain-containing protein n=1 Tax=Armillaria borealis TaxID=47425 RepID=A0AA39IXB9_9AGAR|nr:hypothetical protein EV421DRAFT_1743845 [Armillaria borealis]